MSTISAQNTDDYSGSIETTQDTTYETNSIDNTQSYSTDSQINEKTSTTAHTDTQSKVNSSDTQFTSSSLSSQKTTNNIENSKEKTISSQNSTFSSTNQNSNQINKNFNTSNTTKDINTINTTTKNIKTASNENTSKNIYVSSTGSDSNTGSATSPYQTITKAINTTTTTDSYIIYIDKGTYTLNDVLISNKTLTFIGESSSNTILNLNGNIGFTIDNSNVVFENLTITNATSSIEGATFIIKSHVNLSINNCVLTNNKAYSGSVIYTNGSHINANINNSIIANNSALKDGGALNINGSSSMYTINNSNFINNTASGVNSSDEGYGGAVFIGLNTIAYIDSSNFINNSAFTGSAIYCDVYSMINLTSCNFIHNTELNNSKNNQSSNSNGAVTLSRSTIDVNNCYFSNNSADIGAAISGSSPDNVNINGTIFENNIAYLYGGAFYMSGINMNITNCEFNNNSATSKGGAIRIDRANTFNITNTSFNNNHVSTDSNTNSYGGAIYLNTHASSFNIENSTFMYNSANNGGAIFMEDDMCSASLNNAIFMNNSAYNGGAIYDLTSFMFSISQSIFDSNTAVKKAGAMYLAGGARYTLHETKFTNNKLTDKNGEGGALYISNYVILIGSYDIFENNTANANGGAICIYDNVLIDIENSNLTNNYANKGGAIYINNTVTYESRTSSIELEKCNITNNSGKYQLYSVKEYNDTFNNNTVFNSNIDDSKTNVYNFNLSKKQVSINAERITAYPGDTVNLNGTITVSNGPVITSGTLVIKLNQKTLTRINLTNASFSYTYTIPTDYSAKDYTLTYLFSETNQYARTEYDINFTIEKIKVVFESSNISTYAGNTVILNATVKDKNGEYMNFGTVSIKINGKTIGQTNVTNGTVSYAYTIPTDYAAKEYNVSFVYGESSQYARVQYDTVLTVQNYTSNIQIKNVTCVGRTLTITADITANNTSIYAVAGNAGFKINGLTAKDSEGNPIIVKVTNKTAVFTYQLPDDMKSGTYNITVTYSGGRNLAEGRNSTIVEIKIDETTQQTTKNIKTSIENKNINSSNLSTLSSTSSDIKSVNIIADDINVTVKDNISFTGSVIDEDGVKVNDGIIVIKLNGVTQANTTVSNGLFNYTTDTYFAGGIYNITYKYGLSDNYSSAVLEKTLTINKKNVIIYAEDMTVRVGNNVTINGTVTDTNGNPVNGTMVLKYDQNTLATVDVINGNFSYTMYVRQYSLTAKQVMNYIYSENGEYNRAELNKSFIILYKSEMVIEANNTVAYAGQIANISAYIHQKDGQNVTKEKLELLLDGTLVATVKIDNGLLNYEYKVPANLSTGNHVFTIHLLEADFNEEAETNITLTILKPEVRITTSDSTGYAGETINLNGSLQVTNGTYVTNGTIVIKINGKTLTNINLTSNTFNYKYTLPADYTAKDYNITYVYTGNDLYSRVEVNNTLTIKNQSSKIEINNAIYQDNQLVISATITGSVNGISAVTGNAGFKINGFTAKDSSGNPIIVKVTGKTVTFTYNAPESMKNGNYDITVTYSGGRNLLEGRNTTNLNITTSLKNVTIKSNDVSGYAGETVTLSGTVQSTNGTKITNGTIVIKINGNTVTKINLTSNTFSYKYKLPADYTAKDYNITYVYLDDQNGRMEVNNTLTIKNQSSKIQINNVTCQNNKLVVTATITGSVNGISAVAGNAGFKINGVTAKDSSGNPIIVKVTNKTVTFTYDIPNTMKSGNYNITVTYSGGRNLAEARNSTTLKITIP